MRATFMVLIASVIWFEPNFVQSEEKESTASQIFADRIMPIFKSPNPSTCVQCHLSSVDLKNYILPSHEKTFLSLRDQGLININNPNKSKILKLIQMGERDSDAGAKLIHAKMRKVEYEAFASWIRASCLDEKLVKQPRVKKSELAIPPNPDEVIRHARKSRVIDSFVRNVWSQRMRCFPCHTPHEIGPDQTKARKRFKEWEDEYGDEMSIFKRTPEKTIQYLIKQSASKSKDYLPLLNLETPTKSLLVLKPTSKVPPEKNGKREPTYTEPIYHMGGLKMHADDHSYKSFVAWINDYAKVTLGEYRSVKELPADNWHPTQRILRMRDAPESWKAGSVVQLFVYASAEKGKWSNEPLAFTQGTITPRRIVNGALILLGPTDLENSEEWKQQKNHLLPGEYLVKFYLDRNSKLKSDPEALLGEDDYMGKVKVDAKWLVGFPNAETISAKQMSE